jgi:hypothetical protein
MVWISECGDLHELSSDMFCVAERASMREAFANQGTRVRARMGKLAARLAPLRMHVRRPLHRDGMEYALLALLVVLGSVALLHPLASGLLMVLASVS